MDQICIVALIGLPAAGKTTFSKLFLEIEAAPFNILHICYDDFFNSTTPGTYKAQREYILTYLVSVIKSLKKSKELSLQPCSYKDYGHGRIMVVCDDNNYFNSMRYKLYQIAREFSASYGQIFIDCSVELALQRNSLRSANRVPEDVFHKMCLDLETPQIASHYWEFNSFTLHTDNINKQYLKNSIVPFISKLFDSPLKPLEFEMTKDLNKSSQAHDLDLLMRKRIGLFMNSNIILIKTQTMAKVLNDRRKDILKEFQNMQNHKETDIDRSFRIFEEYLESIRQEFQM